MPIGAIMTDGSALAPLGLPGLFAGKAEQIALEFGAAMAAARIDRPNADDGDTATDTDIKTSVLPAAPTEISPLLLMSLMPVTPPTPAFRANSDLEPETGIDRGGRDGERWRMMAGRRAQPGIAGGGRPGQGARPLADSAMPAEIDGHDIRRGRVIDRMA